jgi:hypothetical protein
MDDLPEGALFIQERSESNDDECHVNVKNLSDKEAGKIIKKQPLSSLRVCINSHDIPFEMHHLQTSM